MVTPKNTPRARGEVWMDEAGPSLPRQITSVKPLRNEMGSLFVADLSAVNMLSSGDHSEPWIGPSALGTKRERSVIPLPQKLSVTSANIQVENGSAIFGPETISFHEAHRASTFSHQSKTTVSRGRIRPNSSSRPFADIHVADASCCGFKHRERHIDKTSVFVTFCESTLQERLNEAECALQKEAEARASDSHMHQVEMIKILKNLKTTEEDRNRLQVELDSLRAAHDKHVREAGVIRDEFERRWKESESRRETEAKELESLRAFKARAAIEGEARQHTDALGQQAIADLKLHVTLIQNESTENSRRAQSYFEELTISRKNLEAVEKELRAVREVLAARDAIVRGMEKELSAANEKLSSIAVLRNSFQGKSKR